MTGTLSKRCDRRTNRQTDGRTDGQTDGQTDKQTDRQTDRQVAAKKNHSTSVSLMRDIKVTHWDREKNCRHFADDTFKCIFLNENVWISFKISLKFVTKVWIRLTHICVTRPQWVKSVALEFESHNKFWLLKEFIQNGRRDLSSLHLASYESPLRDPCPGPLFTRRTDVLP